MVLQIIGRRIAGRIHITLILNFKERYDMEHRVKVTVLDKKLFPELQAQYCAVPDSGKCPCYNVGDESQR